jgi:hypothetical protein
LARAGDRVRPRAHSERTQSALRISAESTTRFSSHIPSESFCHAQIIRNAAGQNSRLVSFAFNSPEEPDSSINSNTADLRASLPRALCAADLYAATWTSRPSQDLDWAQNRRAHLRKPVGYSPLHHAPLAVPPSIVECSMPPGQKTTEQGRSRNAQRRAD